MKKLLLILSLFIASSCQKDLHVYSDLYTFDEEYEKVEIDNTNPDTILISSKVYRFKEAKGKNLPLKIAFSYLNTLTTAEEHIDFIIPDREIDFSKDPDKSTAYSVIKILPNRITEPKKLVLKLMYVNDAPGGVGEFGYKTIDLIPIVN